MYYLNYDFIFDLFWVSTAFFWILCYIWELVVFIKMFVWIGTQKMNGEITDADCKIVKNALVANHATGELRKMERQRSKAFDIACFLSNWSIVSTLLLYLVRFVAL